jgi:hypothetical protein
MSAALKLMTVDEFLTWAEGQEGRWELHDGEANRAGTRRPRSDEGRGRCRDEIRFTPRRL